MHVGGTRLTASATGITAFYGRGTGGAGAGVTRDRPVKQRGSPATPRTPTTRVSPTATWGPLLWNAIHTLTWYDLSAGVIPADCWREFVGLLAEHLPCPECAGHLRAWIAEQPMGNGLSVHQWFVDLHNRVNERQRKTVWTAAAVAEHYGARVDPEIGLINLYTATADLDDYMDESVSGCLRQMIDLLLR